jgi:hypothetical protein
MNRTGGQLTHASQTQNDWVTVGAETTGAHMESGAAKEAGRLGPLFSSDPAGDAQSQLRALELSLEVVWERACNCLGELPLRAIFDRALRESCSRNPHLSALRIRGAKLRVTRLGALEELPPEQLRTSLQDLLRSLVALMGLVTGQILTPGLEGALREMSGSVQLATAAAAKG